SLMPRSRYSKISRSPGVHLASLTRLCTKSHFLSVIASSCVLLPGSIYRHAAVDRKDLTRRDLGLVGSQIDGHVGDMDRLAEPQQVAGRQLLDVLVASQQPLDPFRQRDRGCN